MKDLQTSIALRQLFVIMPSIVLFIPTSSNITCMSGHQTEPRDFAPRLVCRPAKYVADVNIRRHNNTQQKNIGLVILFSKVLPFRTGILFSPRTRWLPVYVQCIVLVILVCYTTGVGNCFGTQNVFQFVVMFHLNCKEYLGIIYTRVLF